jgi:hypothetical protein
MIITWVTYNLSEACNAEQYNMVSIGFLKFFPFPFFPLGGEHY